MIQVRAKLIEYRILPTGWWFESEMLTVSAYSP